jgi:hypothetical protein
MRSRLWCFTNFNLDFDYSNLISSSTAQYIIYGVEECPKTGRTHHQGLIYFSGARNSVKGVAKQLGKCHVQACRGNIDQNIDYCSKDGNVIEFGDKPAQGFRNDLEAVKDSILKDGLSVDDITLENPMLSHQYGRTLKAIEDIALRKRFRTEPTKGIWYHGETGTGKSHVAFANFSPLTHYVFPNDNGWWDGYKGQETVIVNEFRGGIAYSELLDLCDKWPKTVRRRNREPVPFLAKTLIITSSMSPKEVYCNLAVNDSLKQLYRRFQIIEMTQKWSEGNTEPQTDSDSDLEFVESSDESD